MVGFPPLDPGSGKGVVGTQCTFDLYGGRCYRSSNPRPLGCRRVRSSIPTLDPVGLEGLVGF